MIGRILVLAGGLSGAGAASQYPEFSQQYMQRLGGAVDELARFVADFDADAKAVNLSREAALVALAEGSEIGAKRADTVARTIARHDDLSRALSDLRHAGPFMRAYNAGRLSDPEIARATWKEFRPAMPLTFEGGIFAGTGLLIGMLTVAFVWSVLSAPFRRSQPA